MTPRRIQRKRTKGWVKPPNSIYCGRGTKWGNSFKVTGQSGHWVVLDEDELPIVNFTLKNEALECSIDLFMEYISHKINTGKLNISELKGKNLMCWCPLTQHCHCDPLLILANK